jgi:integrase
MSPDLFLDHLRKALEKIGIELAEQQSRDIDFQAWRHFSNSYFRKSISDLILRKAMGHSMEEMTEHYDHLTPEEGEEYRQVYKDKILPCIFPKKS